MTDETCGGCGAPVTRVATHKGIAALNPEPESRGTVMVTESRAVPGEAFGTILKGQKLREAQIAGEDLYRLHADTCRGPR